MNNLSHFDKNKILTNPEFTHILSPSSLYFQKTKTFIDITQEEGNIFQSAADEIIRIPHISDDLASLLSVIPAQLFAYYCAVLRGNNPDKPRNLAKSVTVE